MTDEYANQPSIADWKFIEQLKSPLHTEIHWKRSKKKKNEISLKNGSAAGFLGVGTGDQVRIS